jgi:nuclear pore complex protein Nup133
VQSEPGNINAVALDGEEGEQFAWTLIDTRLQKWVMNADGTEELLLDEEILNLVRLGVRRAFGSAIEQDDAKLDLEMVDLALSLNETQ